VKFDVAWQIFDEINYFNDTYQFIELTCLDHTDAIAIAKQKIFELARHVHRDFQASGTLLDHFVLNVKCGEDHIMPVEDEFGRSPLKNVILNTIELEMPGIDHYYISTSRTILVHIDENSIKIPLFRDKH